MAKDKKKMEEVTGHSEAINASEEAEAPAPIPAPAPAPVPLKTGPMLRGERGERVRKLQEALLSRGYQQPKSIRANGELDGIAGPELLVCAYNYALERNFNYHDDEWRSVPENVIHQCLADNIAYTRGIDIAKYQPVIDLAAAKKYGTQFVVIKATDIGHESQNSFTDALFKTHWANATAAGITKSAYMFWHPALDPTKQANYFIQQAGRLFQPGDMRPVIDVERNDKLPSKEVNLRLQKVIDILTAHFGKSPIIYTSRRVCLEQGIKVGGECPVWLAYYVPNRDIDPSPSRKNIQPTFKVGPPVPDQWKDWDIWQSGYGPYLPGLRDGDEVDRNLMKTNLADLLL